MNERSKDNCGSNCLINSTLTVLQASYLPDIFRQVSSPHHVLKNFLFEESAEEPTEALQRITE